MRVCSWLKSRKPSGAAPAPTHALARRPRPSRRGFTLLEAALATVIISVGVLALIEAQASFARSNDWSSESARASYLASEIRERLRMLPRHDPQTPPEIVSGALQNWGPEEGADRAVPSYVNYDDLDDYDGAVFGAGGTFAGPIDAAGRIVPATDADGQVLTDEDGNALPLIGWSQQVVVDKVDPINPSRVLSDAYERAATGSVPALAVDEFPLRVTVTVRYQGPFDGAPQDMARLVWIQP